MGGSEPAGRTGDAARGGTPLSRKSWHLRVHAVVLAWALAALLATVVGTGSRGDWLVVHLLMLGAVSNAILIWSVHFATTVLPLREGRGRRGEAIRLAAFNLGALGVVRGVSVDTWLLTAAGAGLAVFAVAWHVGRLLLRLRRVRGARFGATVRYYVLAGAALIAGIALGTLMAHGGASIEHARLELAHAALNLLGWTGLTVLGTLLTFWPAMLRTRVVEGAERSAGRALPVLGVGLVVAALGPLLGSRVGTVLGLVAYLLGVAVACTPLVRTALARRPAGFPTWSVLASLAWLAGSVAALAVVVAVSADWWETLDRADALAGPLLLGFAAQVVVGALGYLVPMFLGGGPRVARVTGAVMDTGGRVRVVVLNAALLVLVLPVGGAGAGGADGSAVVGSAVLGRVALTVALLSLATVLPLALRATLVARRGVA